MKRDLYPEAFPFQSPIHSLHPSQCCLQQSLDGPHTYDDDVDDDGASLHLLIILLLVVMLPMMMLTTMKHHFQAYRFLLLELLWHDGYSLGMVTLLTLIPTMASTL